MGEQVVHLVREQGLNDLNSASWTVCGWSVRKIVGITDDGFLVKRRAITDKPSECTCGNCLRTGRYAAIQGGDDE